MEGVSRAFYNSLGIILFTRKKCNIISLSSTPGPLPQTMHMYNYGENGSKLRSASHVELDKRESASMVFKALVLFALT